MIRSSDVRTRCGQSISMALARHRVFEGEGESGPSTVTVARVEYPDGSAYKVTATVERIEAEGSKP